MKALKKIIIILPVIILCLVVVYFSLPRYYNYFGLSNSKVYFDSYHYLNRDFELFIKIEKYFLKAIEFDEDFAPAYANLAYLYLSTSHEEYCKKGIPYALKASELKPNNIQYRILLLASYTATSRLCEFNSSYEDSFKYKAKADSAVSDLLQIGHENYSAYLNAAGYFYSYSEGGMDYPGIWALLKKAVTYKTSNSFIQKNKENEQFVGMRDLRPLEQLAAFIYFDLKNGNVAELIDEEYIDWIPNKSSFYMYLGDRYPGKGRYKDAEQFYQRSLKFNQNNADVYLRKASTTRVQNKLKEAIKYWQKAAELNSEYEIKSMHTIGLIYIEMGDFQKAITMFKSVVEKKEDYYLASSNLSRTYALANMKTEMLESLRKQKQKYGRLSIRGFENAPDYKKYLNDKDFLEIMDDLPVDEFRD